MTERYHIRRSAIRNRWHVIDQRLAEVVRIGGTPQTWLDSERAHDLVDKLNHRLVKPDE